MTFSCSDWPMLLSLLSWNTLMLAIFSQKSCDAGNAGQVIYLLYISIQIVPESNLAQSVHDRSRLWNRIWVCIYCASLSLCVLLCITAAYRVRVCYFRIFPHVLDTKVGTFQQNETTNSWKWSHQQRLGSNHLPGTHYL